MYNKFNPWGATNRDISKCFGRPGRTITMAAPGMNYKLYQNRNYVLNFLLFVSVI